MRYTNRFIGLVCLYILASGCNPGIRWPGASGGRNYEAKYESSKEVIEHRYKKFQNYDPIIKHFPSTPNVTPTKVARNFQLRNSGITKGKPESKGRYRARYELARDLSSPEEFGDINNIGRYYFLDGKIIRIRRTKKYNHFLILYREKNTGKEIALFAYVSDRYTKPSNHPYNQLEPDTNARVFSYYGGYFQFSSAEEGQEKEKLPTFFVTEIILEE